MNITKTLIAVCTIARIRPFDAQAPAGSAPGANASGLPAENVFEAQKAAAARPAQLHCAVQIFDWNIAYNANSKASRSRPVHGFIRELPPGWEPLSSHGNSPSQRFVVAKKCEWR